MGRKRIITLKLTRKEADVLLETGNRGVADLHDAQDDESLEMADIADAILDRLGRAAAAAWPEDAANPGG